MPDDDRFADTEVLDGPVDLGGHGLQVAGRAGAGAVGRQVDRDRAHVRAEALDDRPPTAAVEREAGEQHDRHAGAVALEGQGGRLI